MPKKPSLSSFVFSVMLIVNLGGLLQGKKVLVLGGAGFIGSHLVERLLSSGAARVVVADNFFLGNVRNLDISNASQSSSHFVIEREDAANLSSLRSLVLRHDIDLVFNLAVIPLPTSITSPSYTFLTNVNIASNCCELARAGDIERLIHISSSEVYGSASYVPMDENHPPNPSTPYAASKLASDHLVLSYKETFNISADIIRPFNNFGPRQNPFNFAGIIPSIMNATQTGDPIKIYGDGKQTRDYVYVEETSNFILMLAQLENSQLEPTNLASGHEISVNELVSKILCILGKPDYPIQYQEARPGDVRRHSGDTARLLKLLGQTPKGITDEYLLRTIDWYRSIHEENQTKRT